MRPSEHPSRSLIWALVESGGLSLISLLVILFVARLVGPAELGAFAVAIGIVQVLTIVIETLTHDAIIQRTQLLPGHLDTAFWTCLVLGISLTTLCWFSAPEIGSYFHSDKVQDLLSVTSLSLVFSGAASIPVAMLRRDVRFKPLALRSLVGRLCGAIVAIALIAGGYGVWSLVMQHVVQTAACTVLLWPATKWRPSFTYSPKRLRELLTFGIPVVGTRLVWLCSIRFFVLLIGNILGVAAVGYINIAQRMVDTLFDLLAGAAHNLALPIFARHQNNKPVLAKVYGQATELTALAALPLFAGLAACAYPMVDLFLGKDWAPAAPLVQILATGAMLQFIFLYGHPAITALGRPGVAFTLSLITLVYVIAVVVFIGIDSAYEATMVWTSRVLISAPVLILIVSQLLGISRSHIIGLTWMPLFAALAMVASLLFVQSYWFVGVPAWRQLASMVPLGAAIYVIVVALIGWRTVSQLMRFLVAGIRSSITPVRDSTN
jgi:O-antigen/teichoic acid export membrane protein